MGKLLVSSLVLGSLVIACSGGGGGSTTAVKIEDFQYPLVSSDASQGEVVYATFCEGCHPGAGMAGDGPKIAGDMWTPAQMRWQVRAGGDDMPAFGEDKITRKELDDLLAYAATFQAVDLSQ